MQHLEHSKNFVTSFYHLDYSNHQLRDRRRKKRLSPDNNSIPMPDVLDWNVQKFRIQVN